MVEHIAQSLDSLAAGMRQILAQYRLKTSA